MTPWILIILPVFLHEVEHHSLALIFFFYQNALQKNLWHETIHWLEYSEGHRCKSEFFFEYFFNRSKAKIGNKLILTFCPFHLNTKNGIACKRWRKRVWKIIKFNLSMWLKGEANEKEKNRINIHYSSSSICW